MSIDALASPPRPAILAPGTSVAPARRGWVRQLGVDTAYTLTGLPLAVAAFGVTVTGLALGAGLAVLGIGLVVLSGTLLERRATLVE